MPVKVAINGFGRIGRLVLRSMIESGREDVVPMTINDLGSVEANAHLFRYDSVHGRFPGTVEVDGQAITIHYNGRTYGPIIVFAERDPTKVPFDGVDVAMECTGIFTSKEKASQLITAGARRVLISAPGDGVDATVVYGVNHDVMHGDMTVVSNASCTTNCLAPVAKVLHDEFGILRGYMLTIHAYTGDQNTVDTLHKDLHRARAARRLDHPDQHRCRQGGRSGDAGAERASSTAAPSACRRRTCRWSSLDVNLREHATVEQINAAMKAASEGPMKGILDYNTAKLVSIDFNHNPASSTFDATQTAVVDGQLARVMSWYDNEWGFSNRMSDTAALARQPVRPCGHGTLDGVGDAGKRGAAARRSERAGAQRPHHRPQPHRAAFADDPRAVRQRRTRDRVQPLRPAEGQGRAGDVAPADGAGARRSARPCGGIRR